jgi:hypothetical protein
MMNLLKKLTQEYFEMLPPAIFFFIAFSLILVTKAVILSEYGISWTGFGAALLFRYLEPVIRLLAKHGDFMEANRHLVEEIVWPHFWLVQMWLAVLLFVYCALREMVRVIGKDKVVRMFFGGRSAADRSQKP